MEQIIQQTGIAGVEFQNLAIIPTTGGNVLKMLRPDNPFLPDLQKGFGELYFSEIEPGITRAWKCHQKQQQLFCVPEGLVKIGIFDGRPDSPTYKTGKMFLLGRPDFYGLLKIPPGIWYGFSCISEKTALICNFADIPHDPLEIERTSADGSDAPIKWTELSK